MAVIYKYYPYLLSINPEMTKCNWREDSGESRHDLSEGSMVRRPAMFENNLH